MTQPNQPQTSQEQGPRIFVLNPSIDQNIGPVNQSVRMCIEDYSGKAVFTGSFFEVIRMEKYQSLQQRVSELEAKHKQCMKDWSADAIHKTNVIVKLEAENKRFREALDWISKQSITLEDTVSDLEKLCNLMSKKAYLLLKALKGEEK